MTSSESPSTAPDPGGGHATPGPLAWVRDRLYADYVMPSRLSSYAGLLELALDRGYAVIPVGTFGLAADASLSDAPAPVEAGRRLVLRHDIDTDPATARAMWALDLRLGVRSTYFFRQSTVDIQMMREIGEAGGEASYHYEELAALIKRYRLRTREQALERLPEARWHFATNLDRLRAQTGLPMRVVASHGDFANRRLGIANWELLADPAFRRQVGVDLDPYDAPFLERLPLRFTDVPHPRYWSPSSPEAAIRACEPVVSILVHPRHWRTDRGGNSRDNAGRLVEELRYRLPLRRP